MVDGGGPLGIVPGHQHLAPGPSPPHTFADPPEDPLHFVAASVREQMGREEEELSAFLAAPIRDEHGTVYRPVPPTRGIHQTITLVPIHEVPGGAPVTLPRCAPPAGASPPGTTCSPWSHPPPPYRAPPMFHIM